MFTRLRITADDALFLLRLLLIHALDLFATLLSRTQLKSDSCYPAPRQDQMEQAESNRQEHERASEQNQKPNQRSRPNRDCHYQTKSDKRQKDSRLLIQSRNPVLQVESESLAFERRFGMTSRIRTGIGCITLISHLCRKDYKIFLPSADKMSSTANNAV